MTKNAQINTERRPMSPLHLQELSAQQRAPALHAGSCSLLPVPRGAAASPHARGKCTVCPITGNTNLCLEIRVKIFVDLKGEEISFMFSIHTIVWRSALFLAEKNL